MHRTITYILFILLTTCCATAQWAEPAKFTVTHKAVDGARPCGARRKR